MPGDIIVTYEMGITFLNCYHFNVFEAAMRISFRKIDVWQRWMFQQKDWQVEYV